jgi:hypothetical protein
VSLAEAFEKSKNLGKLSQAWWPHLQKEMAAKAISTTVKAVADQAASLIAPAALIANIVRTSFNPVPQQLRVLVLGRDPIFRIDSGRWISYAGDFLGIDQVEILTLIAEDPKTSISAVAEGLGLPAATVVDEEQILTGSVGRIDMVLWVHPLNEIVDADTLQARTIAIDLAGKGIPVFACHFNEVDHISQSVILESVGLQFELLKGSSRQYPYVNRFGIASRGTGVRGGWGAMMSRVAPSSTKREPSDIAAVRCALGLLRAEGGGFDRWTLGDALASPNGASARVIGLLGDMAVDKRYGRVFFLDDDGKRLEVKGQVWQSMLKQMPDNLGDLVIWASRLYVNFAFEIPPAESDRKLYMNAMEEGISAGLVEASIGLARCLEGKSSPESKARAESLYQANVRNSPMAAYYVAHTLVDTNLQLAADHLQWAADQGYAHAVCDMGRLIMDDKSNQELAEKLFQDAADLGDVVAMYHLGMRAAARGDLEQSKASVKPGVEMGDPACADVYLKVIEHQIKTGAGDRSAYRRQQSWVRGCLNRMANYVAARA